MEFLNRLQDLVFADLEKMMGHKFHNRYLWVSTSLTQLSNKIIAGVSARGLPLDPTGDWPVQCDGVAGRLGALRQNLWGGELEVRPLPLPGRLPPQHTRHPHLP